MRDAHAQAGGQVVAQPHGTERGGEQEDRGQEHDVGSQHPQDVGPRDGVQASGQPDHGLLRRVDVGVREHPVHERPEHRGEGDPDEHHPTGGTAAAAGLREQRPGDEHGARERGERHRSAGEVEHHHGEDGAGAGPGRDAEHVGAGERVAQQGLEGAARGTEGRAREDRHERAGQGRLEQHEGGTGDGLPAQDAHGVREGHPVRAEQRAQDDQAREQQPEQGDDEDAAATRRPAGRAQRLQRVRAGPANGVASSTVGRTAAMALTASSSGGRRR